MPYLAGLGITVVTVNPYHVKKQKELDDNSPTKKRPKRRFDHCHTNVAGRFSNCYLPTGVWAELRGYTAMRQQQKRKLNASLNNLVAILDEYFPEYQEVFKTLAGKASQHVLRHTPFPEDMY
ncbi:MAG: hypothetical protein ACOX33_10965 [Dethiobacteria bacterium]